MDDVEILDYLKKNTDNKNLSDFVCDVFMKEFIGVPWTNKSAFDALMDKYLGD